MAGNERPATIHYPLTTIPRSFARKKRSESHREEALQYQE